MKRYLVFIGEKHHSKGGMNDFKGDYDFLGEAKKRITSYVRRNRIYKTLPEEWKYSKWCHIYDTKTKQIIYQK